MIISVFTGCAAQKHIEWSVIGGSRSDTRVKLAYNYKYGTPNLDINQAIHLDNSIGYLKTSKDGTWFDSQRTGYPEG